MMEWVIAPMWQCLNVKYSDQKLIKIERVSRGIPPKCICMYAQLLNLDNPKDIWFYSHF